MTREEWLIETEIKKALRTANVIIEKHCTKTMVAVDYRWEEWIPETIEKYGFDECRKVLINLCFGWIPNSVKTMTIKWIGFGDDEKVNEYYIRSKFTRDLK